MNPFSAIRLVLLAVTLTVLAWGAIQTRRAGHRRTSIAFSLWLAGMALASLPEYLFLLGLPKSPWSQWGPWVTGIALMLAAMPFARAPGMKSEERV